MPASQVVQLVLPLAAVYMPAAHFVHDDDCESAVAVPGGHGLHSLALAVEYEPAGHDSHDSDWADEYVPPSHGEHAELSSVA